jgi:hypothetical protein
MRSAKSQLKQYQGLLKDQDQYQELITRGDTIMAHIDEWEQNLLQTKTKTQQDIVNFTSRLGAEFMFLKSYIDNHDPRLTAGAKERMQDLEQRWSDQKARLQQIIEEELSEYNRLFKEQQVPAVILKD